MVASSKMISGSGWNELDMKKKEITNYGWRAAVFMRHRLQQCKKNMTFISLGLFMKCGELRIWIDTKSIFVQSFFFAYIVAKSFVCIQCVCVSVRVCMGNSDNDSVSNTISVIVTHQLKPLLLPFFRYIHWIWCAVISVRVNQQQQCKSDVN